MKLTGECCNHSLIVLRQVISISESYVIYKYRCILDASVAGFAVNKKRPCECCCVSRTLQQQHQHPIPSPLSSSLYNSSSDDVSWD